MHFFSFSFQQTPVFWEEAEVSERFCFSLSRPIDCSYGKAIKVALIRSGIQSICFIEFMADFSVYFKCLC